MALIEELVRDGETERAKSIIRESPDECPMPPDYPHRIHTLMTRGIAGLADLVPLTGFEDRPEPDPEPGEPAVSEPVVDKPVPAPPQSVTSSLTLDEVEAIDVAREKTDRSSSDRLPQEDLTVKSKSGHQYEEPTFDFEKRKSEVSESGEIVLPLSKIKGGAGALVERKPIHRKRGAKPPAPNIDQEIAAIRWENYSGILKLTEGRSPEPVKKISRIGDRISAMSFAMIVHLIAAVVISLVVIHTPRPNPPVLVVTMPDVNDSDDLIVHKLTKPAEIEPSAASMQAVNVLTSVEMSNFALPEVEDTRMLNVTAMVDGMAEIGAGMKLSLSTHQQSDVNFFGISSGGKKIVFVIDATKPMLVDEKGGMFAYDKVKNEIGSMLVNLNRGTKFNILVYSGKTVRGFREQMVPGLPSNIRLAMEWLAPLNSDYDNLGIPRDFGFPIEVTDLEGLPIAARDVAHYTKCIQKAMEWQAAAIFCISGGYERMSRSPSPEMLKKMKENPATPGSAGKPDPADKARFESEQAKWDKAVAETTEWLRKENEARKEKGLAPKVVLDFNQLVQGITGATRPRRQAVIGATTGTPAGGNMPPLAPIGLDDIDIQLRQLVIENYKKKKEDIPSVHMVIFLGKGEDFKDQDKEHFSRIVQRNNGKLKMLRGLAALQDVTGK